MHVVLKGQMNGKIVVNSFASNLHVFCKISQLTTMTDSVLCCITKLLMSKIRSEFEVE